MPGPREQVLSKLGRALASVGHDLNNLAGVVQTYAAFIQDGAQNPAIVADAQVIRESVDKAASMARQLLAFGHAREQEPEALDLAAFASDLQAFSSRAFGQECPVELQVVAEPVAVRARRAPLGCLMLDLVLAAHEVLALGSSLRLGVTSSERGGLRRAAWAWRVASLSTSC